MSDNISQIMDNLSGRASLMIRADASAQIGTGHVMRCIALGQAWQDAGRKAEGGWLKPETKEKAEGGRQGAEIGKQQPEVGARKLASKSSILKPNALSLTPSFSVVFICAEIPDALAERIKSEGFDLICIHAEPGSPDDLRQTLDAINALALGNQSASCKLQPDITSPWLVLDGYHFNLDYQRGIRAAGHKLLLIDDYNHLPEYECDILLNQNFNSADFNYRVNLDCIRFSGVRYALLRREFKTLPFRRHSGINQNLLITMGGGDFANVTQRILDILDQTGEGNNFFIKVVLGPANPHKDELKAFAARSMLKLELLDNVIDMPSVMEWAGFAISAAGSICMEFLHIGLPAGLIIMAENQRREAFLLEDIGGFRVLGDATLIQSKNLVQYVADREELGALMPKDRACISDGVPDLIEMLTESSFGKGI